MALLSHMVKPSSSSVGMRPVGFMARYSGVFVYPEWSPGIPAFIGQPEFLEQPDDLHDIAGIGATPYAKHLVGSPFSARVEQRGAVEELPSNGGLLGSLSEMVGLRRLTA